MRHFAADLESRDLPLHYQELEHEGDCSSFGLSLEDFLKKHSPERVILTRPGEHSVLVEIEQVCIGLHCELELREDNTFLCSLDQFADHARDRKQLRMEYFYREMRRKHSVLMDGKQPVGGKWNFDSSNRRAFGKEGPQTLFKRLQLDPDKVTLEVIELVNSRFADHPGNLDRFNWPVNRRQALACLDDFINNHLAGFGPHQDAMWTGEPFLSHSLIASSLNLKFLNPQEVITAAESAYRNGAAPIESVEGFIRQILGWREYVRGIYWMEMPGYLERNQLEATNPLPKFYWNGDTEMVCMRAVIEQTLESGYAHHIQRLMVTGLYALLAGVNPQEVHKWYLSVYVDAVEWVELPNTLGMSQYADGGIMASKPYAATGKYISRMSNYCIGCRYNPAKRTGDDACPFTVLYWDFLARNEGRLKGNHRMGMQLRNLRNISGQELVDIRCKANEIKSGG
jgi:deoxyribodipyrimidine photolyase-related protein